MRRPAELARRKCGGGEVVFPLIQVATFSRRVVPSASRILQKPVAVSIIHEIRKIEVVVRANALNHPASAEDLDAIVIDVTQATISVQAIVSERGVACTVGWERQTRHVKEVKDVQVLELVRRRRASRRDTGELTPGRAAKELAWLA
jgi:hypothetical protein